MLQLRSQLILVPLIMFVLVPPFPACGEIFTNIRFIVDSRTGMTVSQVVDELLYTGLIEMQEMYAPG